MRSATRNRAGKDGAYLAWIRKQPCAIPGCHPHPYHMREAAHVGLRGLSQKCPDAQAIPLCPFHHRLDASSHHRLGKLFWSYHELDREHLIGDLHQRYEEWLGRG